MSNSVTQSAVGPDRGALMRNERRHKRRFPLCQAVVVRYGRNGADHLSAVTENASLDGTLLVACKMLPIGSRVNVTIQLRSEHTSIRVDLQGSGRVVRVESRACGYSLGIAYDRSLFATSPY